MLVVTRKPEQAIVIPLPNGSEIRIVQMEKGRIGIEAPRDLEILREELIRPGEQQQQKAA